MCLHAHHMIRSLPFAALVITLSACAGQVGGGVDESADDVTHTTYVDAQEYWKSPADQSAWLAMMRKIESEFNDVCGDTFCGGDYSNLTSLGFTCSVTSARGSVHECVWAFTG